MRISWLSWMHIFFQFIYGNWKISRLHQPIVTIFGSARIKSTSPYNAMAHEMASLLVKDNISIITGGGGGIMSAANCGARHAIAKNSPVKSLGITVKGLDQQLPIICAQDQIVVDNFFVRKWLMMNFSAAFVIFPGGFGTLDEFSNIITLMQTKHLAKSPIILIGKDFWQPLLTWLRDYGLEQHLFTLEDLNLIYITDDLNEAMQRLKEYCQKCQISKKKIDAE